MNKSYNVHRIPKSNLTITGKATDNYWNKAIKLIDFSSPWNSKEIKKIEFRALWDSEKLFFTFKVEDPEVYIHPSKNTHKSINNSDRVELFFRSDSAMNPYYCLEIDPTLRIMDFKAKPNKEFDFNWNWPSEDIDVKASIEKTHFIVEGAINIYSLETFGLLKNRQIETGIYRAKYNKHENGNYEPTWVTWVNPKIETPNFHVKSSFGVLKLI
ncbi:MAG: sugar-binding protein [Polaribacter sp.]